MGMLSVCYAKVKTMLNMRKVEMLSLGYGNVKTRLRQNYSLTYTNACKQRFARRSGFTYIGAEKLGAEKLGAGS